MRKITPSIMAAALLMAAQAHAFKTSGNGTTYTLASLSQIEAAQILKYTNEDNGQTTYRIHASDTIAAGDSFVMDDGVTLQFDDNVQLVIQGEANFKLTKGSVFGSASEGADDVRPVGLYVNSTQQELAFENCEFHYVGLRAAAQQRVSLKSCGFYNNNGAIGQAALVMNDPETAFYIDDCRFEGNAKAAIASAANYFNPLTIVNSTFRRNGQNNGNTPQLNLTVSKEIVISNCTIEGDPSLTMVGGIGISNFYGMTDTHVVVSGCDIRENRYGIGLVGTSDIRIENNQIVNNCHETNAMNGGSGISLYDPYLQATAVVAGNHIEGNLWGITIIGCKDVNVGQPASSSKQSPGGNTFKDNGNGGKLYDLYNNSALTVYAQNNTWNVSQQTEEQIETVIFHQHDDSSLGKVIFMPAADVAGLSTVHQQTAAPGRRYNLQGRRIGDSKNRGIYIENGRKVQVVR